MSSVMSVIGKSRELKRVSNRHILIPSLTRSQRSSLQAALGVSVIIARVFLASTLLLSACTLILQPGLWVKLISAAELSLGIIIAADWHIRYAGGVALLGTVFTSFLAGPFRMASTEGHVQSATALMIASVLLLCFGQNEAGRNSFSIPECGGLSSIRPNHHFNYSSLCGCRSRRSTETWASSQPAQADVSYAFHDRSRRTRSAAKGGAICER